MKNVKRSFLDIPVKELFSLKKKKKKIDLGLATYGWNISANNLIETIGGVGELFGLIICIGIIVGATILAWWFGLIMLILMTAMFIKTKLD